MPKRHPTPEQQGKIVIDTVGNPAAGAGFTITLPDNVRWKLKALTMQLVTDANVANRLVQVIHNGVGLVYIAVAGAVQTAGLTVVYSITQAGADRTAIVGGALAIAFPNDYLINDSDGIQVSVANIQVGDQISAISYTVEEWIEE